MSPETQPCVSRVGLRIDPLDVLFFRDGRPFDAASRAYGGLPLPRTIAGALRTAFLASEGFDFTALRDRARNGSNGPRPTTRDVLQGAPDWILRARFRGPWLALVDEDSGGKATVEPLLPVPATLARVESEGDTGLGKWCRTTPRQGLPGRTDPDLMPLWRRGDPEAKHPRGFLTPEGIRRFLEDRMPDDQQWYEPHDLFDFDARTGIGIDADTLTTARSQIYGVRMLALRRHVPINESPGRMVRVMLYEEVEFPVKPPADLDERLTRPIPLGGEGRQASLKVIDAVDWPGVATAVERSLWLLATPGIFGGGNGHLRADRPDALAPPARLRAAASDSPLAVSGWDIAMNGPRPTRFAVPGGAVYYVEGTFEPDHDSLCSDDELVQEGWGFALRGVWNDG